MNSMEPSEESRPGGDGDRGGSGFWLGPLLLAAAPFVLFFILLAVDRLLP